MKALASLRLEDGLETGRVVGLGDGGVEAVVPVGRVVHHSDGTVGLHQAVLSLHDLPVALLVLVLAVTGVGVVHAVLECVPGMIILQHTGRTRL